MRVLIVEDEPLIAEDIAGCLEAVDFEVAGMADSVSKALDLLSSQTCDVVLLDINLGDGPDGVDLAHEIRKQWDIPFVFLTSHADRATIARVKETLPSGYLLKPFDENDLLTTLEIALANHIGRRSHQDLPSLDQLNNKLPNPLSARELEIIALIRSGNTNQQVADAVFLSVNTVKSHLLHIYEKLDVKNRTELMFRISQLG
ncbi:MAG: response regulator transcription factor [Flavobacteriales bacterium]|nr:response regulator transcription factor [Flavobacteriales bacterium]